MSVSNKAIALIPLNFISPQPRMKTDNNSRPALFCKILKVYNINNQQNVSEIKLAKDNS
jgi:hypothetical protein